MYTYALLCRSSAYIYIVLYVFSLSIFILLFSAYLTVRLSLPILIYLLLHEICRISSFFSKLIAQIFAISPYIFYAYFQKISRIFSPIRISLFSMLETNFSVFTSSIFKNRFIKSCFISSSVFPLSVPYP